MNEHPQTLPASPPNQGTRSEGLLPADGPDENLEVAEEVSLDLQSDATRRVGTLASDTPAGKPADALAQTLAPDADADDGSEANQTSLRRAIERAVPPSA